jgi:endonuclease/exonuclease/phosphatase family metal-dependent hydrolase
MVRIATFNCENLFFRYNFKKNTDASKEDGFLINELAFDFLDPDEKSITGAAIDEVKADIIALQEIESITVLDHFDTKFIKKLDYEYKVLIDGHDPRQIDVAVMSKYPIVSVRTHRNELSKLPHEVWLFSRDCLEVEIDVDGKSLFLYINHFKSMLDTKAKTPEEGRANTKARREEQVKRVKEIIDEKWKDKNYNGNFVVLGDFNDYPGEGTALNDLIKNPGLVNVVERLPVEDQWTHFYAKENDYEQLDYILLSKSLAEKNPENPGIMRMGIAKKADKYQGPWLDKVGKIKPVASDHAPVYMDLKLE